MVDDGKAHFYIKVDSHETCSNKDVIEDINENGSRLRLKMQTWKKTQPRVTEFLRILQYTKNIFQYLHPHQFSFRPCNGPLFDANYDQ